MKKRRVVFFDVYKTLINIKTDENDLRTYAFLADWLLYKGVRISPKDLLHLFKKITKEEYESSKEPHPDVEIGKIFKRIIHSSEKLKVKMNERVLVEEISLLFRILTTKSISLFPYTRPLLEHLRTKARLAIISNAQRLFTMPELIKFDLVKYFEHIIFSSDLKSCKPGKKIFLKALKDLKVEPQDALYVGDSLFDDIGGAKSVGMSTVWMNHGNANLSTKKTGEPKPNAEVKPGSYNDLPEIISSML